MAARQIDVSLVIVNYRTRGLLKNCLRGLFGSLQNVSYEVIVVDNNSRDGSVEMVAKEWPTVCLVANQKNKGYAVGVNSGLRLATGRYLLVLNTDLAFFGEELEKLVSWMDRHPKVGLGGPKLLNPNGSWQTSCRTWPTIPLVLYRRTMLGETADGQSAVAKHLMKDFDHQVSRPVNWLIGAALIVRREALAQVGLMDERFFLYFEDVDWARRFWRNNWEVWYIAEVSLVHYHQQESSLTPWYFGLFNRLTRAHMLSGLKYFWKYHDFK